MNFASHFRFAVSDTDEDLLFGCIDKTMEGWCWRLVGFVVGFATLTLTDIALVN